MVDLIPFRRGGICGRLIMPRPRVAWPGGAGPGLDDLLADDVIQSMMQADGVDPSLVRTLVLTVARTRKARKGGRPAAC